MNNKKEWFSEWFDSEYYHILYSNRNEAEAENFIGNLYHELNLKPGQKVMDLACGKGRHSFTLNKLGLNVTGLDLALNSIEAANQFSNETLKFGVHDMREKYPENNFDVVFNLFTSFGYFDEQTDNEKVLKCINENLKPNGILVIDFMNEHKVVSNLVKKEEKTVQEIKFIINRRTTEKHIYKNIQFLDYEFEERVQRVSLKDFIQLFEKTGFKLKNVFGNFNLNEFNLETSDRLVLIAEKVSF